MRGSLQLENAWRAHFACWKEAPTFRRALTARRGQATQPLRRRLDLQRAVTALQGQVDPGRKALGALQGQEKHGRKADGALQKWLSTGRQAVGAPRGQGRQSRAGSEELATRDRRAHSLRRPPIESIPLEARKATG